MSNLTKKAKKLSKVVYNDNYLYCWECKDIYLNDEQLLLRLSIDINCPDCGHVLERRTKDELANIRRVLNND